MSLKKITLLSVLLFSNLSFSGRPLKEQMTHAIIQNKTTIKNTLEGATAGTLVGACSSCLCTPIIPISWKAMTIVCCVTGAITGFIHKNYNQPKNK